MTAGRHAAGEQRRRATAVVRQEARCDARRCRTALRSWAAVTACCLDLQVCMSRVLRTTCSSYVNYAKG